MHHIARRGMSRRRFCSHKTHYTVSFVCNNSILISLSYINSIKHLLAKHIHSKNHLLYVKYIYIWREKLVLVSHSKRSLVVILVFNFHLLVLSTSHSNDARIFIASRKGNNMHYTKSRWCKRKQTFIRKVLIMYILIAFKRTIILIYSIYRV